MPDSNPDLMYDNCPGVTTEPPHLPTDNAPLTWLCWHLSDRLTRSQGNLTILICLTSHSDQLTWLWHFLLSWYASSADLVARWTYLDLDGEDLVPGRLERLVLCVSGQPGVVQFQHGERVGAAAQVGCIESLSPVHLTRTILYSNPLYPTWYDRVSNIWK